MKTKKKLKTLEEHNSEYFQYYRARYGEPEKNGISCPQCGEELWDSNPMVTLTSHPAQKNVHCDCGYVGYRIA